MAYSDTDDMDQVFGSDNVTEWADADADADSAKIAARKARAIAISDAEIEDVCRVTGYKIPLQTEGAATPTTVENLSAVGAGIWLLETGKGTTAFDQQSGRAYHKWMLIKEWRNNYLERIRTEQVKLDALRGY